MTYELSSENWDRLWDKSPAPSLRNSPDLCLCLDWLVS